MKSRIENVDVAKGISIFMVALFHSKVKLFIPEIIEPMSLFRMPLFFFLSGVFFSHMKSLTDFIWHKFDALLKPYFTTLVGLLLIRLAFDELGGPGVLRSLKGILYGTGATIQWAPLWFLTHLFAVYVFSYAIYRYTGFASLSVNKKIFILNLSMLLGSWQIDAFWHRSISLMGRAIHLPGFPFSLDIILISSAYFISGQILRDRVVNFKPNSMLIIFSILVFWGIAQYTDAHMDLNTRVFRNPVFLIIGSIAGIYIIMSISHMICESSLLKKPFLLMGSGSLFILIFHVIVGREVYGLLVAHAEMNQLYFAFSVVSLMVSIVLPLLVRWIVRKNDIAALFYFPLKSNKLFYRIREVLQDG